MNEIKVAFLRGTTEKQFKSTKREDQKGIWIKTKETVLKATYSQKKTEVKDALNY